MTVAQLVKKSPAFYGSERSSLRSSEDPANGPWQLLS